MDVIKNDKTCCIGANFHRLRKERKIGQTELVRMVQLEGIPLTRETLVKIERGIQHVKISQLRAIRTVLKVSYDDLLDGGG